LEKNRFSAKKQHKQAKNHAQSVDKTEFGYYN
jgi:hypothetical protein